MASSANLSSTPLLVAWNTPFGLPPFESVLPEHYRPAFDQALTETLTGIVVWADTLPAQN